MHISLRNQRNKINQLKNKLVNDLLENFENQYSKTLAQPLPWGFNDEWDSFTKIERVIHKILGQDERVWLCTHPGFCLFFTSNLDILLLYSTLSYIDAQYLIWKSSQIYRFQELASLDACGLHSHGTLRMAYIYKYFIAQLGADTVDFPSFNKNH